MRSAFLNRFCESINRIPAVSINTAIHSAGGNSQTFTEFSHTSCNPIHRKYTVLAGISSLLLGCLPSAIAAFVIAAIVDSSNAQAGWSFPHISQKGFELQPAFTHLNPTTTVIRPLLSVWIATSLDQGSPCIVGAGAVSINGASMFEATDPLPTRAATGFCIPGNERSESNDRRVTAVAHTFHPSECVPVRISSPWSFRNHFEASKSPTDHGQCCRHGIGYFNVVLSGGRPGTTGAHCDILPGRSNEIKTNQQEGPWLATCKV